MKCMLWQTIRGASTASETLQNEYPQHMFSWRNKENIYLDIPLFWSYSQLMTCSVTVDFGYFEVQGTL